MGKRCWTVKMLPPERFQTQHSWSIGSGKVSVLHWLNGGIHLIKPKYPSKDVVATPTVPFQQINRAPNELWDLAMHQVIDRREWCKYRGCQEAINNERDGLLENATWLYDGICCKDDLIKPKKKHYFGRLWPYSRWNMQNPQHCASWRPAEYFVVT